MTYDAWIAEYRSKHGDGYGKCEDAVDDMVAAFPELRKVAGHVYCPAPWGKRGHFWCETEEGQVVDPTAAQFPGIFRYEEWQPGSEVYAGHCMDCGVEIWLPLLNLAEEPENPHAPFCSSTCLTSFCADMGWKVGKQ